MKGKIDIFGAFNDADAQIQCGTPANYGAGAPDALASATNVVESAKRAAIYVAMKASMKYMASIRDEEEFLGNTSDLMINIFAIDSAIGRALQAVRANNPQAQTHVKLANFVTWKLYPQIRTSLERIIESAFEGKDRAGEYRAVRGYLPDLDVNGTELSRGIADLVLQKGGDLLA